MTALIIICAILFALIMGWQYLALFAAFIVIMVIIILIADSISTKNATKDVHYAVIVDRVQYMSTKSRPSGFSISSKGNMRAYWRFREEVDHIKVTFEVHYINGNIKIIKANEGTQLYNRLISYVGAEREANVGGAGRTEFTENAEKQEPQEPQEPESNLHDEPETSNVERKSKRSVVTKRYIDVPFEVVENEYKLSIFYPSCQIEASENGEFRINVRFRVTYDPTVKGVRSRIITCATIDKFGRMTDTANSFKTLDLSGSRIVNISFWKNAEEEPAKILVGLEQYN